MDRYELPSEAIPSGPGTTRFDGPDGKPWNGDYYEGHYIFLPCAAEEGEDAGMVMKIEQKPGGKWSVSAVSALDTGPTPIIVPEDGEKMQFRTVQEAFWLGWLSWLQYLACNRRCPFCRTTFEIPEHKLDGTVPTHRHRLGAEAKTNELNGDGNCIGSGVWVEELLREHVYLIDTAASLLMYGDIMGATCSTT